MYLHVAWTLYTIINNEVVSEVSLSSLLLKRATLFQHLENFLLCSPESQGESKRGNQLACRVSTLFDSIYIPPSCYEQLFFWDKIIHLFLTISGLIYIIFPQGMHYTCRTLVLIQNGQLCFNKT